MILIQSLSIALDMLRLHKLRAVLTMLGVIIGVMSVTIIVMVSEGFQRYIDTEFKRLGSDTFFVFFDWGRRFRGETTGGVESLKVEDVDYILNRATLVGIAAPLNEYQNQEVRFGELDVPDSKISAVDHNFLELNRFKLLEGRWMTEYDLIQRANICIIGEEIRERLFQNQSPIGQRITLKGITLEIVGVIEKVDVMGQSNAKDIYVPFSTVRDKWLGGDSVRVIMMRPKEGVPVSAAMEEVWQVLMRKSNNRPIYRVDSRESILNVFGTIISVTGIVLSAIAALSLLVGGIGIMNIMLVSVTERTREIGLRKAVGAKRPVILIQFLVEAAVLSLAGGLIGMGLGWIIGVLGSALTKAMEWPGSTGLIVAFPILPAIYTVIFSAAVGMVFGLYPAWSASRLDPIVALRAE